MRRRLAIGAMFFGALVAAPAAASAHHGYWACVGTYHIDFGICVGDPLPERLPEVPPVPQVPELPPVPPL